MASGHYNTVTLTVSSSGEERHAAELVTGLTMTAAAALLAETFWLEPAVHGTQLFTRDEELGFHNSPWLIYFVVKSLSLEQIYRLC